MVSHCSMWHRNRIDIPKTDGPAVTVTSTQHHYGEHTFLHCIGQVGCKYYDPSVACVYLCKLENGSLHSKEVT